MFLTFPISTSPHNFIISQNTYDRLGFLRKTMVSSYFKNRETPRDNTILKASRGV